MAKDVARNRTARNEYYTMSTQLKAMANQMTSMQMQKNIMESLQGSTAVMSKINEDMNVQEIAATLKEFNKQMGINEIKGEQIQDGFEMFEDPNA